MKNTGLDLSTTLNPWNYGDPVEAEAEEPEKREFDPDAFVALYDVIENGFVNISFCGSSLIEGSENFSYDCIIDWGDGSEPQHVYEDCGTRHYYEKAGIYYVTVTGNTDYLELRNNQYLIAIEQWGNLGVKTWYESMKECRALKAIPTEMPDGESFFQTFSLTGLKSIPAGLFSKCTSAKSFEYTFNNCVELETIGEGAFDNCVRVETFERAFQYCPELKSIPTGLFKDCINVTSFEHTFDVCRALEVVPEGLFDACTKVETFESTFAACTSLASVTSSLFDYNAEVTNFNLVFAGCGSLTGVTPNTNGIELWMRSSPEYPQYPDNVETNLSFAACENLANYDDIPEGVK